MSNSSLVNYTKISTHKTSPRNHAIDTITIHCVVGQLSVEGIGACFQGAREVSSNYGIGSDGRIGLYVDEKDRSWCSSSGSNDHRAITIECASDTTDPYAINDKVYKSLVKLCTDICKRNNIKELKWKADNNLIGKVDQQNMTVHRWFANKSCPGDYIYNRLGQIASEVNANLGVKTSDEKLYRVQVGAYIKKANATALSKKIKAEGFETYIVELDGLYKVQVGAYREKPNAESLLDTLKSLGFKAFITDKGGNSVTTAAKKSVDEIAREVIQGLWGAGIDRKTRLTNAGYDYTAVQKQVNKLL